MDKQKYEVGVPIPTDLRGRISRYDFSDMPINASFAVEVEKRKAVISALQHYKAKHKDWKYTSRTVVENGKKMLRIWRIS